METKKTSKRAVIAVMTTAVVVGLYWSAYENESNLAKDEPYYQNEMELNKNALPFIMDSFQETEVIGEAKIVEVNEIGEPLSVDFLPTEQEGLIDVNLGETMDVSYMPQNFEPPVELGSTISVDYMPLESSDTVVVNIGENLNVDDYFGNKAATDGTVNIGELLDVDEYLKQQNGVSPTKG